MSEKDTVFNQDIPALVRALGTLALAAATAVAIKRFISRDIKEEKADCNREDQQNNLCSRVQDEQTTYNDCLDGIPLRNTNPPEVSDGDGKKCILFQKDYHDFAETSCISQNTITKEENGQQIDLSFDNFLKKENQVTSVDCKLNKVTTFPADRDLFIQREVVCNASIPPATTRCCATNATEDQMFFGRLTHRCDSPLFERSASIHNPECSFGTSSSYGECFDDLNTRCSGFQHKQNVQDNPGAESFVQHSTVVIGVTRDTLIDGPNEEDGVLNYHSEKHFIKDTTFAGEQNYNIDNIGIEYDKEEFSWLSSIEIRGRNKVEIICNAIAPEAEIGSRNDECIPKSHNVPVVSDNFTGSSAVHNSLPCTEVLSPVQKTLSVAHKNVVSEDDVSIDIKQNVTLSSRIDSQGTNIYQLDGEEKLTLNNNKVTEIINVESKSTIEDAVQKIVDDDTGNTIPSFQIVLPNKESSTSQQCISCMDAYTGGYEARKNLQSSSHSGAINSKEENRADNIHCYPNKAKVLPLLKKSRATTLYNYAEQPALICPLDFEGPDASLNIQGKENEHQFDTKDMSVALINMGLSKDLTKSPTFEKHNEDIDVTKESVELYCTTSNADYTMTTVENIVNDSTSFGTVNSMVVTEGEFISDVKSISCGKTDTEFQNWNICKDPQQNCNDVITNGYLEINHEVKKEGNCHSKVIKKQEHCVKYFGSAHNEPCSTLLNTAFPTADISLESGQDSNVSLSAMIDAHTTVQTSQHNANEENDVFQESVSINWDNQHSGVGDNFNFCTKTLPNDNKNKPMCSDSHLDSAQEQCTCSTCNNDANLNSEGNNDAINSRENIMSTIAENPELILPEYQSKISLVKKRPLMAKSCDNIISGRSYQEPTLKIKAQSMLCLLTEYYSSKQPSENGPVEEVARGSFIRIPKGLQSFGEAMRFQLTLGNCLEILKLARKNSVPELLKAVYTVISDNYLNVLKNSAVYGQLTGLEREKILQLRMRGNVSLCVVETKSIFGLNKCTKFPVEKAKCKPQLYSLHIETNQWRAVTSIPEEACLKGCSICSMHNYLFIAGGLRETNEGLMCSNKLFCYNPLTDIWIQLSPMNEGRSQLKLIPLDGYLYAIGGECLHTVEKYDPRLNKWTFVAPLPKGTFAVAHEAAACGGEIFISGGHLFFRLLKYSPVHDQWEECPFNASKGRSCDMVAVGSILYRFDMHKDSFVNILKYNTMARMWSEYTATFPGSKLPFRCALWEGNIYCINRETTAKFSIEGEKALFEEGGFSKIPTRGEGSPHPTVLYLRESVSQTSV
ncbi:uncharacterized protein [Pyxicephalus adspersus]